MTHLTALELENWLALYAAAGICCAIAALLSIGVILVELRQERAWTRLNTLEGVILALPRTWWRWQKLYFLSAPMTLTIVGTFALTLAWD